MNLKILSILVVCAAVIAAAVACVKNGMSREAEARAFAEAAASEEAKAEAGRKTAKAEADKAENERRTAEANAAAKADAKEAARLEKEEAELKLKSDTEVRKAKEAAAKAAAEERETAKLNAAAAADSAKAAADEKEKAKALENAQIAKAAAEADRLEAEKLRSEKVIAEAKALELAKIDFETWQRDLLEFEQALNERERALKPDKTVADLAWVGGTEDKIIGTNGTLQVLKKKPYLAENDRTLPQQSRRLARAQRLVVERESRHADAVRSKIVSDLEKLYVEALKEDRVVDAEFYKQNLETLYPDWEFKGDNKEKEQEKQK